MWGSPCAKNLLKTAVYSRSPYLLSLPKCFCVRVSWQLPVTLQIILSTNILYITAHSLHNWAVIYTHTWLYSGILEDSCMCYIEYNLCVVFLCQYIYMQVVFAIIIHFAWSVRKIQALGYGIYMYISFIRTHFHVCCCVGGTATWMSWSWLYMSVEGNFIVVMSWWGVLFLRSCPTVEG